MERVPCPPEMIEQCSVFEKYGACREDVHHEYWPKPDYTTKIEREFRGLDVNKLRICRAIHNAIHATEKPPQKPSRNVMVEVINREKTKRRYR